METIVIANFFVFTVVACVGMFIGLDLKKWSSWLYGAYGLLSGILIGLFYANLKGALELGVLFAFFVMFGGATTRMHRLRYKKWISDTFINDVPKRSLNQ